MQHLIYSKTILLKGEEIQKIRLKQETRTGSLERHQKKNVNPYKKHKTLGRNLCQLIGINPWGYSTSY